ncbi:hypothetical protein PM082_014609 [Marasmius tenuissimus]|nr:hypothetical protein PM082_014609 [Marasmius tenuissimus]
MASWWSLHVTQIGRRSQDINYLRPDPWGESQRQHYPSFLPPPVLPVPSTLSLCTTNLAMTEMQVRRPQRSVGIGKAMQDLPGLAENYRGHGRDKRDDRDVLMPNPITTTTKIVTSTTIEIKTVQSSSTADPSTASSSSSKRVPQTIVLGVVIAVVALVLLFGAVLFCTCRRHRRLQRQRGAHVVPLDASSDHTPMTMNVDLTTTPTPSILTPFPLYRYPRSSISDLPTSPTTDPYSPTSDTHHHPFAYSTTDSSPTSSRFPPEARKHRSSSTRTRQRPVSTSFISFSSTSSSDSDDQETVVGSKAPRRARTVERKHTDSGWRGDRVNRTRSSRVGMGRKGAGGSRSSRGTTQEGSGSGRVAEQSSITASSPSTEVVSLPPDYTAN